MTKMMVFREAMGRRILDAIRDVRPPKRLLPRPEPDIRFEDSVPFHNAEGSAIPQYGIVWLKTADADGLVLNGYQCDYTSNTTIGIATGYVPASSPGRVWIHGIRQVLVDSTWTFVAHRRLDVKGAQWYAEEHPLGVLTAIGIANDPGTLPAGTQLVWCAITGRRGDPLQIHKWWAPGTTPFGYHVLHVGAGYTVSYSTGVFPAYGRILIEK